MGGSVGKLLLKLQPAIAWKWRRPVLQLEQAPGSVPQKSLSMLRVHISRGSFVTVTCCRADDDRGAPPMHMMDAEVWGKLPEELIWEVVRFVPAAKLFQLHLVSCKWRRVLTSPDFRKRVTAGAKRESDHDHEEEEPPRTRVVGCVEKVMLHGDDNSASWWRRVLTSTSSSTSNLEVKEENWNKKKVTVVDIDLSSLVPAWFWSKHEYSVVAAGDGLVCSSELEHQIEVCEACHWHYAQQSPLAWQEHWKPWANRYCVLNPLTRTCMVLPELVLPVLPDHEWMSPGAIHEWLPPTASVLTAYTFDQAKEELHMATYDLAATGGGGGWVSVTHKPETSLFWNLDRLALAVLASRSSEYWVRHQKQARALEAASTDTADDPWVASSLCLDFSSTLFAYAETVEVHPDTALLVVRSVPRDPQTTYVHTSPATVLCCVWRLAAGPRCACNASDVVDDRELRMRMPPPHAQQLAWKPVARLRLQDLERLTGLHGRLALIDADLRQLHRAYLVGELLCYQVLVHKLEKKRPGSDRWALLLAVDMGTGAWELLHAQRAEILVHLDYHNLFLVSTITKLLELRPDVFLS